MILLNMSSKKALIFLTYSKQKDMVHQLSAGVLEALRDVLAVLFIKITLFER